jgi:hypothetical protein
MKTSPGIAFVLLAAICCIAQSAAAGDPPELVASREDYVRNLQLATLPVLRKYLHTLDDLKQQFTRENRYDALTAVVNESKVVQDEIDAANKTADLSFDAPAQPTIISASYGKLSSAHHVVDVTQQVRKAIGDGQGTLKVTTELNGGIDPAKGSDKEIQIVYMMSGQQKTKVFPEHYTVSAADLN